MTLQPAPSEAPRSLSAPPPLDPIRDGLFLDLDGTLVAIAARPDAIQPDPGLVPLLLRARRRLGGRLAMASGRSLADLERHLGAAAALAGGLHGAELRGVAGPAVPAAAKAALEAARATLAREARGLLVEDKGLAIALHFRERPALGAYAGELAARLAGGSGGALTVQPGRAVFELKPAGIDKGGIVRAFLAAPPFAGCRPVFAGDDITDEAGFRAAAAAGGHGVLVGRREPTAALHALSDVAAVHAWLRALAAGDGA